MSTVKEEQTRQARQLDVMARDMHGFASDLYDLRIGFNQWRAAS
ncbi:MAG TPA: hypothetical protein VJZ91_01510 [Blastocatellia bacterium]|nr:hypothetical protein [Blastocatellia bacterium]